MLEVEFDCGVRVLTRSRRTQRSCSASLHLLSDPTRYGVVLLLLEKPLHVHQIKTALDVDATLLSHHLRVLRDAGLVVAERKGKAVLYHLSPHYRTTSRSRTLDFGCCTLKIDAASLAKGGF